MSKIERSASSLTMRLKDKFHPPRVKSPAVEKIKRTQSHRTSCVQPYVSVTHADSKPACVLLLEDQQRSVLNTLRYFQTLVDKLWLADLRGSPVAGDRRGTAVDLLCGAAGQILEATRDLVQAPPSQTVSSSCLSELYGAVAQLIGWTDQLTLRPAPDAQNTEEEEEDVSMVRMTTAIQTAQDAVKELVRLANETPGDLAPSSPRLSDATSAKVPANEGTGPTGGQNNLPDAGGPPPTEEVSAPPPKPPKPLPLLNLQTEKPLPLSNMKADKPLPLPNMKADKPLPLPNMKADKPLPLPNMEVDADKPLLLPNMETDKLLPLPNMEVDKPLPLPNMVADKPLPLPNMETDRLLPLPNSVPALPPKKRHSVIGSAPCRVTPMTRIEEAEFFKYNYGDMLSSVTHDNGFLHKDDEMLPPPPALPQKRRSAQGIANSLATPPDGDGHALPRPGPSPSRPAFNERLHDDRGPSPPHSPSDSPPPLPEKKHHIHQYLQFVPSCSSSESDMFFYQRSSQNSHKGAAYAPKIYQLTHQELPTVPRLPPKRRPALVSRTEDGADTTKQSPQDDQRGSEEQQDQGEDEEEGEDGDEDGGVLLMDQQDVLDRLTLKTEEEEGPDVKAGSPDVLLVHATEIDSNDQRLYCEAFLSTYRSFISPYDVISKLQHRYSHLCKGIGPVNLRSSKNTFLLLVRVVDEICAVELDGDLQALLMELVFQLVIGGELSLACLLRTNFLSKLVQRRRLIGSPLSLRPLSAMGVAARPGTLSDFRSQDVAEQLTLLDSELFYKIELPEVLLWSKEQNEEKCPNLTEFTQHFNNVSFWVRSVIILQDRQTDREKLMLKFIKVMKHLRKLNNFNSYLCVLSALDSAPLSRLDWQRSTAEALQEYSSLIDSSSSFRNYRAALAEVEPPCIPYLGLILQDLTFVHLGNPDQVMTSQGSRVNFSKRWQQFNILDTVRSFQQTRYSLGRNEDIVSFFNGFSDHLAEEALWELSLRIRPRNTPRANQR